MFLIKMFAGAMMLLASTFTGSVTAKIATPTPIVMNRVNTNTAAKANIGPTMITSSIGASVSATAVSSAKTAFACPATAMCYPAAQPTSGNLNNTRIITLNDNHTTVNVKVGEKVLVQLAGNESWTVSEQGNALQVFSIGQMVLKGTQAEYLAVRSGDATISATGDICPEVNCLAPVQGFTVTIRVIGSGFNSANIFTPVYAKSISIK